MFKKNEINQVNQIKQFHSEEFGSLEVLMIEDRPYFPATECALILGYKNPQKAVRDHCKGVTESFSPSAGGLQRKNFIPEGDLYRLIVRSRLPAAERFESFVFDIIIPSIRKFGAFIETGTLEEMIANPEFTAALLEQLQKEQAKNAELAPKASYYDRILQSKSTFPISLVAKDYGMSAVKFNLLLHELGIQYRIANTWLLYQEYANKGYTQTRTFHYSEDSVALHTCWTQRGRLFLYDHLLRHGIIPLATFLDETEDILEVELYEFEELNTCEGRR